MYAYILCMQGVSVPVIRSSRMGKVYLADLSLYSNAGSERHFSGGSVQKKNKRNEKCKSICVSRINFLVQK